MQHDIHLLLLFGQEGQDTSFKGMIWVQEDMYQCVKKVLDHQFVSKWHQDTLCCVFCNLVRQTNLSNNLFLFVYFSFLNMHLCVISYLCPIDIDECSTSLAKCSHGCVNMLGSFSCVCHPGFELGADGKQCYREYKQYKSNPPWRTFKNLLGYFLSRWSHTPSVMLSNVWALGKIFLLPDTSDFVFQLLSWLKLF